MASTDPAPIDLRVRAFFPTVKDFERRENSDIIVDSLRGPDRIEARQQVVRERLVAAAELKLLQEELRWCYHKEGVNHYGASVCELAEAARDGRRPIADRDDTWTRAMGEGC